MKISQNFGKALYHARIAKGLTQKQAAERIGISTRWYQQLEKGGVKGSLRICMCAARELGVSFSVLTEDSDAE